MTKNELFLYVLLATAITFGVTALGSALVFFFKKDIKPIYQKIFLGFAAGIMIAASVWSLLIPAIEMSETQGGIKWLPAALGFVGGALFLLCLDKILPHIHPGSNELEGLPSGLSKPAKLVFAVTLHNIPEGIAIGVAFASIGMPHSTVTLAGAFALAIGIALQNFPEGAALSLPLKKEGMSNFKSFLIGSLSAVVEPIGGIIGFFLAYSILGLMPWMLSFAAGAMIYVVVEELIPEANQGKHSNIGTIGIILGFVIMMILDVALG